MRNKRDVLFPGVPVVFSGINDQRTIDTLPKRFYTGIHEKKDILSNLILIQKLFPEENNVLLIGDGSSTTDVIQNDILRNQSTLSNIDVQYVNYKSLDMVLKELKTFKGKNVVLTTVGGFRSSKGNLIPLREAVSKIVHAGDFHVFSLDKNYIQQGVLGGFTDDGVVQGREAAKLSLNIFLNPRSSLPSFVKDSNGWFFDIEALEEQNIKLPDDVAAQSTFLNPPETFYQKNESFITNFIFGLLATIMVGSLVFIRYLYQNRKIIVKREKELFAVSDSLNKAQELAHLGNWVWDISATTLWWSDEIYRMLGFKPQEFKASYKRFLEQVHPDDRDAVEKAVNQALLNQADYRIVYRLVQADGNIRHVLEEGSAEYENAKASKMTGTVQDITESFKKEEALLLQAQMFDAVQDSIMVHDLDGRFIYLNDNAWKSRGYTHEEMMGMMVKDLDAPESAGSYPAMVKATIDKMKEEGHIKFHVEHVCKNGEMLPVEIYAKLITLEDKPYVLSSVRDISEQLASEKEIDKLSKVVEQIDDSVMITDKTGNITYVNQAFCKHTGFSRDEVIGEKPRILKSGKYDNDFYKELWKTILSGNVFRETLVNKKQNGDLFYENKTITPLKDDRGLITGFVSSGKDVTLDILMHQDMERIATVDKLTGIYNRHKFEELFALEAERSRRFSQPLSMILIDIDHFKSVNDTYGHDIGDEVLKIMAKIIQDTIRQIDIFARWGGEEFLILSPSTDLDNIQVLAEKLRLAVSKAEFPKVMHITISQGVSVFGENDTLSSLFKRADMGLYHAKEHGRNRVGAITR
jgi:diguanylate cyclase (GGDEF)-like protein/PAS domain S-box-containing protein